MKNICLVILSFITLISFGQPYSHMPEKLRTNGFIENKGQIMDQDAKLNPRVKYLLNSPGFNVQLRQTGFSYDTYTDEPVKINPTKNNHSPLSSEMKEPVNVIRNYHRVDVELLNCNSKAEMIATGKSEAYYNYFISGTAENGISEVHKYDRVIYKNIYANIDLEFRISAEKNGGRERPAGVEYDFIVHPGGDPENIRLAYNGASEIKLEQGKIIVKTTSGTFSENIPSSYLKETMQKMNVSYKQYDQNIFGFNVNGLRSVTSDLIIDPTPNLSWGSYCGDEVVYGEDLAIDKSSNTYVTGYAFSTSNLATAGAFQVIDSASNVNAFIAKFSPDGTSLIWGTYYGGQKNTYAVSIALDNSDNVYITGRTDFPGCPVTTGAWQSTFMQNGFGGGTEAYIAKFNTSGTNLLWATYYGHGTDLGWGIAVDASNNVYITGETQSTSLIATAGSFESAYPGAGSWSPFVAKFDPTGSSLVWGTYLGDASASQDLGKDIAVDLTGNVYVCGKASSFNGITSPGCYNHNWNGAMSFVLELNNTGSALLWGTYYGKGYAQGIALDGNGNVYITGSTYDTGIIATPGAYQTTIGGSYPEAAYVAKFNPGLSGNSQLVWGSYYGGLAGASNQYTYGNDIALDNCGNVYITGSTNDSSDIATPGTFLDTLPQKNGSSSFVAKFNASGSSLLWGTYYGGYGSWGDYSYGIVLNACNEVYIAGTTGSPVNIATPGSFQNTIGGGVFTAFVAKFTDSLKIKISASAATEFCKGDSVRLTASGGDCSTIYSWSPSTGLSSAAGSMVTAKPATTQTYTVTGTSSGGCSSTQTVTVTVNTPPSIHVTSTNAHCSNNDGTAYATASSGSSPYTYLWSTGASTVTITGLPAITYTITVTDNNGCAGSSSVTITNSSGMTATAIVSTAINCSGGTGSVSAITSGGTALYTYKWSNGTSSITSAANNSISVNASATYVVTITDANGCTTTSSTILTEPSAVTASISPTNLLCNGASTGTATVVASGGTGAFTYTWSNGGTTATATNLSATDYSVTVNDANGCIGTSSITLTQPSAVTINITPSSSNCGGSTGSAIATASGGTGTLTYSWSNTVTGQTNNGLAANTYILTVTDANACTTTQAVIINSNSGPSVTGITSTDILCNGSNTGGASATISGGSGPYTYSWISALGGGTSSISNSLNSSITNQLASTYSVTIIDANSCQVVSTVTITEPPVLVAIAAQVTPASCGNSNGVVSVNVTGGTGPDYTYSWSNGQSSITSSLNNSITSLASNTYIVTVTDANGCSKISSAGVNNSPAPSINSITATITSCIGSSNGSAVVSATGTSTLTYNWSSGSTTTTQGNLAAGTYTVTVSDANSCKQISTVAIMDPAAITISSVNTVSANCNKNDGSVTAAATGGTGTLTYSWSGTGASGPIDQNLAPGNYILTVTDANGCTVTNAVTINSTNGPTASTAITSSINCNGQTGSLIATATSGTAPYTYSWSAAAGSGSTANNLAAGNYTVTVTDKNGCTSSSAIVLTQPAPLTVIAVGQPASCGGINGIATAVAGGGSTAYIYSWNTGATTAMITGLTAASYSVLLTDANGCTSTSSAMISNSIPPVASVASTQTTIIEGNSTILIGGGGSIYSWTPSSSLSCTNCATPEAHPDVTTTYTLYVKDGNGCVDSTFITIDVKKACSNGEDIFIANIFSPNGDGQNDVLNIEGNAVTNIYWSIYDRWGNEVFETTDQSQGWDGSKNGSSLETGTYVYYLKAICTKTNAEIKLKGNVSIVK